MQAPPPARPKGPRAMSPVTNPVLPAGALPPVHPSSFQPAYTSSTLRPLSHPAAAGSRLFAPYRSSPGAPVPGTYKSGRTAQPFAGGYQGGYGGAIYPQEVLPNPMRTVKGPGSSMFLHQGFFDIFGIVSGGGGRSDPPPTPRLPTYPGAYATKAASAYPIAPVIANMQPRNAKLTKPKKDGRRISVDMIGKPNELRHLCHASDAEQAEAILRQWQSDGMGKLAEPEWVAPIKQAARMRSQARGVAEVASGLRSWDASSEIHDHGAIGGLHVVNGMPSMMSSATLSPSLESDGAVEDEEIFSAVLAIQEGDEEEGEMSGMADTIIFKGTGDGGKDRWGRPTVPDFEPDGGEVLVHPFDGEEQREVGKRFAPSLTTVEKAVATKVYLENHYYGILKRPRDRDQRKAQLEKELAKLPLSAVSRENVLSAWALSESSYLRDLRTRRISPNAFVKLKTIGHGAFGVVSLVQEKGTGELFAMKQLRKADMLRKGQEGHVRAERDVMAGASSVSRWIVRLVYSFQDVDHLYLVMEYMGGGDLLNLLVERDTFPEEMAKFYIAEMVLAVEEAHKLGFIHRDIKPDNFLFDREGHIKISDFGLATDFHWAHDGAYYDQQRYALLRKHGIDLDDGAAAGSHAPRRFDRAYADMYREAGEETELPDKVLTWRDRHRKKLAYSVVGTNNYMAPEVLRGMGYDQACDWWSLGVIMFEMLFGFPAFVSKSRHTTRQKILQWRTSLRFPHKPRISREAQTMIEGLLCEKEERLGSKGWTGTGNKGTRPNSVVLQQRGGVVLKGYGEGVANDGAEEIKAQPWFRGIDFANIHLRQAPFVPQLRNPADTRYFEDDIDANPLPPPDAGPNGPPPNATKDPMLRHKTHGPALLEVRKQLAFVGYTFKGPRREVFDPRLGLLVDKLKGGEIKGHGAMFELEEDDNLNGGRGRTAERSIEGGSKIRSMSL